MATTPERTLAELESLDDLRNDPDQYLRFITEQRKKIKTGVDALQSPESLSYFEDKKREEEKKITEAKFNELENQWGWAGIPDLVLESVMERLSLRDRFNASRVCKTWYWAFHSPRVWREMLLEENSFVHVSSIIVRSDSGIGSCVKRVVKTGPHKGWLNSVGEYIKCIRLAAIEDYSVLSGHCAILKRLIAICNEELGYYPLPRLKQFSFAFTPPLLERETAASTYLGTGGHVMHNITSLVTSFRGLEDVRINDLLLETMEESTTLVLGLVDCCGATIRRLELLNLTRDPLSAPVFLFCRLHTLVVSPPQITEEMVFNFGESSSLKKVHIIQDKFSTPGPVVPGHLWQDVRQKNPDLRLRLQVNDHQKEDVILQEHAPVSEILYNSKYSKISSSTICSIVENYSQTLTLYAHTCLPRFHCAKSFHDRCDAKLVLLARNSPQLETLVVREKISTGTLLLLASRSRHIKKLIVRRNAVVKKCEWPKNVEWTDVWFDWLRQSSSSYERTLEDIRDLLRQPGWNWLSDAEFSAFDAAKMLSEDCGLSEPNSFVVDVGEGDRRTEDSLHSFVHDD